MTNTKGRIILLPPTENKAGREVDAEKYDKHLKAAIDTLANAVSEVVKSAKESNIFGETPHVGFGLIRSLNRLDDAIDPFTTNSWNHVNGYGGETITEPKFPVPPSDASLGTRYSAAAEIVPALKARVDQFYIEIEKHGHFLGVHPGLLDHIWQKDAFGNAGTVSTLQSLVNSLKMEGIEARLRGIPALQRKEELKGILTAELGTQR